MFIRFVVGTEDQHHRGLQGVIQEAGDLKDAGRLEPYEIAWLLSTYAWLNANLPVPPFERSRWSDAVVCWFKADAGEPLRKMWELASLLEEHGRPVRVLRSRNPGKVVYEDDYQVVVEEWRQI